MGFLGKIFSGFTKNTYKGICRAMINSYRKVKQQNPKASKRELYASALSLRPTWKRKSESSFTFTKGKAKLIIEENDDLETVVMKVIIEETLPLDNYPGLRIVMDALMKMPGASELFLDSNRIESMLPFGVDKNFITITLKEISEILGEEFKDFKE